MAENRGYMQRYAMLFGTYMGGFWILKFILFPVGLSVPFLLFLFMGLTLCVPFMGYYYARMYRNQVCGGGISFLHAWVFTVFMYMFAALLSPIDITLQMISSNVFWGSILAFPTALFVMRRKKDDAPAE